MKSPRKKICIVTTAPIVVRFFLLHHLRALVRTFDVTLVANEDCTDLLGDLAPHVRMTIIPIQRQISPLNDMIALVQLAGFLRRERFDGVVSVAPKAGLVGHLAGFIARTPYRCHVFQGEVWASRRGLMRMLLRAADRVIAACATEVLVVSQSERDFLVAERILPPGKSLVLCHGSICGVDTTRFAPDPAARERVRQREGIPSNGRVALFVGRLQRDKGVLDLVVAFSRIAGLYPDLHLAIVGPDEDDLVPSIRTLAGTAFADRLHICGFTSKPEEWMAAADVLCLPSYREGFGNVLIEAGATGIPVIASLIYGIADAMVENQTGLAHPPADRGAIARCLIDLLNDAERCRTFGAAARRLAVDRFEQASVVKAYTDHFALSCNAGATA